MRASNALSTTLSRLFTRVLASGLLPFVLFTQCLPLLAAADDGARRPKVGLVLSGGAAFGMAHIGVLKALEELRIPIDCIAGTSVGAAVGGLYSSGLSPEEIDDWVR